MRCSVVESSRVFSLYSLLGMVCWEDNVLNMANGVTIGVVLVNMLIQSVVFPSSGYSYVNTRPTR